MCFTKTKKCTIVNLTVLFCFFFSDNSGIIKFCYSNVKCKISESRIYFTLTLIECW